MPEKIQKVQIVNQPVKTTHGMMDEKPHKMPSYLSLDSEDLPAIADWSVGKKYTLMVEVEQTSMSKDGDEYGPVGQEGDMKKHPMPMRARFKILSVKVPGENSKHSVRDSKLAKLKEKAQEY